MSNIEFPETRREVAQRIFTDIQTVLSTLDPAIREQIVKAIANGEAGRLFDIYVQQQEMIKQLFPTTATEFDFVEPVGILKKITPNTATKAIGFITTEGTAATLIPEGTQYSINTGAIYEVIEQDYEVAANIVQITEISRAGNTVTFKTEINHNLASNIEGTISGIDQSEYNGTFVFTVINENEAQYTIDTTPAQPTGTNKLVTYTTASIKVEAVTAGAEGNLAAGAKMTLTNPIADVNDDAYVQFTEIGAGAPDESFSDYDARVIFRYQNPVGFFSIPFLINEIKKIAGNTRAWGFPLKPEIGDVTLYFTRDNNPDTNIPNLQEVSNARDRLLQFLPANMDASWLHVEAPSPKTVDFDFGIISPDSSAMRDAIKESLKVFFRQIVNVSENIKEDSYRSAVWNTINPESRERIQEFSLVAPIGDVPIDEDEIGILGTVSF
jgi:uncharacterized phage protein gp47/JayE